MPLMRVGVKRVEYGYAYVDTDEVDPVEADYNDGQDIQFDFVDDWEYDPSVEWLLEEID